MEKLETCANLTIVVNGKQIQTQPLTLAETKIEIKKIIDDDKSYSLVIILDEDPASIRESIRNEYRWPNRNYFVSKTGHGVG